MPHIWRPIHWFPIKHLVADSLFIGLHVPGWDFTDNLAVEQPHQRIYMLNSTGIELFGLETDK
jgi:hypothetical protein